MWYDLFSLFYDRALEEVYAPFRRAAVEALDLSAGASVLDLPCGTGQSFDFLVPAVGPTGIVLGVDRSRGMLHKAGRRAKASGWDNVTLRQATAASVDTVLLTDVLGWPQVDGVLCALGLTALPAWESVFKRLFSLVRPGGRFVLFDVYASEPSRETRMVELVARADLSRAAWKPLAAVCVDFKREVLPADVKKLGGELYIASGTRKAT